MAIETSEVVSADSLPRFKDAAYMAKVARTLVPGQPVPVEPEGGYARAPLSGGRAIGSDRPVATQGRDR